MVTEDGYILAVYRIPGKVGEGNSRGKPPILMQHGVFDSAYAWIVNYADNSPAFIAVEQGYDVWLGNSRGNTYSRAHVELDPDRDASEFWAFDWQEMGLGDLPAVIDYILAVTDQPKIAYVGHSQGTTQMFYALAENEAYFQDKVSLFVALAPVTKITNQKADLVAVAADIYTVIDDTAELFHMYEIGGANWF